MAMATALKKNSTLQTLNLKCNHFKKVGCVKAMAEALKVNTTLLSLNLEYNEINVMGAMAISDALNINDTLLELNLDSNKFPKAVLHEIQKSLSKENRKKRCLEVEDSELDNDDLKPSGSLSTKKRKYQEYPYLS